MSWARQNKYVSEDTNMSLAAGLTGYQFAQAAELMRNYEGWKREEFDEFKRYMLVTWYPVSCTFLRSRHDTWSNWRNGNKGQRHGHYWSNWGLCNAFFSMILGVICDDVFIYNQGNPFYKYNHVGTFRDRSKEPVIVIDGCNYFIGNLVPVLLPDSRCPCGFLGQMQESGRDQGHALLALCLAVDICKVAFNQGDDLFAYMNDRLAAESSLLPPSILEALKARIFLGSTTTTPTAAADCIKDGSKKVLILAESAVCVADNGSWKWSTGEQTKDITVTPNRSFIYRVTYTADSGAVSTQSFSIAVAGDCTPDFIRPEITEDGTIYATTEKTVEYGKGVILYAGNSSGWTDDYKWSNGMKSYLIVIPNITEERTYKVNCTNQGGNTTQTCFHIKIQKRKNKHIQKSFANYLYK